MNTYISVQEFFLSFHQANCLALVENSIDIIGEFDLEYMCSLVELHLSMYLQK